MILFQGTIKYEKVNEEGIAQKVSEKYLFDAESYTEAEATLIKEMEPYISGEFEIADIKKQNIAEVFECAEAEADKWYIVKIAIITLDEKTAKEKRTACRFYQQAESFERAVQAFVQNMHSTMCDWQLLSVSETPIMDYFKRSE